MRSCLVLLVALAMVTLSMAGNCSTIDPITMDRDSSLYSISGGTVRVIPVKNGETLVNSAIRWELSYFIERAKVTRDIEGNAIDPTAVLPERPDFSIWSPADPLESHDPSKACTGKTLPCGEVLNYLDPADYDCWMEHVTAPFHGFTRESVFVHFSHPSYPDLSIVVGNHLLDGYLEVRPPMQGLQDVNVYLYAPKFPRPLFLISSCRRSPPIPRVFLPHNLILTFDAHLSASANQTRSPQGDVRSQELALDRDSTHRVGSVLPQRIYC
jgi:hypothetical protein